VTTPSEPSGPRGFHAAVALVARVQDACADEVRPLPYGVVLRTPSLPEVHEVNALRVDADPGFGGEELSGLADVHLDHVAHRRITVLHEELGERIAPELAALGYRVEREVLMVLGETPPALPGDLVRPGDEDEALALMDHWNREERPESEEDEHRQVVALQRREARAVPARWFVTGLPAVAVTLLRTHDAVAQVEDVYTHPDARGQGHARALVTHAARLARLEGHELVFVGADAEDTPRELYAKLGFASAGTIWRFLKPPGV
jgi:GNAT superfamily N-acetyltransferase